MNFEPLDVAGAFRIAAPPLEDERGAFTRFFDRTEFAARGLATTFDNAGISTNPQKATLRGLHLQLPPHDEVKLVQCRRGVVHDVLVDLRPESPTFLRWCAVELRASTVEVVYVPAGVAHGYVTLTDETELEYLICGAYTPSAAVGVRWDDPALSIAWPVDPEVIGARDRVFPSIDPERLSRDGIGYLRSSQP